MNAALTVVHPNLIPASTLPGIAEGFLKIRGALEAQFPEREHAIGGLLVAIAAGEHGILFGPPGTAKSALARTVAQSFALTYWERLLTKFSVPEEIFGPLSLTGLQNDQYVRVTTGYMPEAQLCFVDEIFKANSSILNSLLTILNERVFHNNGKAHKVPLHTCIAASNEGPEEGPELEALYDRFLVRIDVHYLADEDNLRTMLVAPPPAAVAGTVDLKVVTHLRSMVTITEDTLDAVMLLHRECKAQGVTASDRRWKKTMELLKARAILDGRLETDSTDLEVLEHALWRTADEFAKIRQIVTKAVNPSVSKALELLDAAREECRKLPDPAKMEVATFLGEVAVCNRTLRDITEKLTQLGSNKRVLEALAEVKSLHVKVSKVASKAAGLVTESDTAKG